MELGDLSDLTDGEMRCFADIGDDGVVVCRVEGRLHAFVNRCSHALSPLDEGRFRGTMITCPRHGARFDVRDGAHQGPPASVGLNVVALDDTDETAVTIRSE